MREPGLHRRCTYACWKRIYRPGPQMRGGIAYSVFGVATFAYLCLLSWLVWQGDQAGALRDSLTTSLMAFLWTSWIVVLIVGIRSSFASPARWVMGLCGVCIAASITLGMLVA